MQQFFYDGQIRRFLEQFIRALSGFQVEGGYNDSGEMTYITVPIKYGNASKQAQTIIQENSANSLPCAPQMTVFISNLRYRREDLQEPHFVDNRYIRQREYDTSTGLYKETQGNAWTVERHMPAPYELGLKLDIWTTNINHRLQILEQILPLFNPSLELQSDTNYLDWTSLSTIEIEQGIGFSSRNIGFDDSEIDFTTISFKLPIWISMPARVSKDGIIHKVIANIYDDENALIDAINGNDVLLGQRVIVTAHGYQVFLYQPNSGVYTLQILPQSNPKEVYNNSLDPIPEQTSNISWHAVIDEYGKLLDGISKIRLRQPDGSDVEGYVSYSSTQSDILNFNLNTDTIPSDTLNPIDAIINPLRSGPDAGLISATIGQRYLLTENIGYGADISEDSIPSDPMADAWAGINEEELIAHANDIVEYDGSKWVVSFDSTDPENTDLEYVSNITTLLQYKWKDGEWLRSYEGIYDGGTWSIVL